MSGNSGYTVISTSNAARDLCVTKSSLCENVCEMLSICRDSIDIQRAILCLSCVSLSILKGIF